MRMQRVSVCVCGCIFLCGILMAWEYFYLFIVFIFPPSIYSLPAEECSYWLPLYGSMCCRLAAQPHCMTQQMMSGCLKVKVSWQACKCALLQTIPPGVVLDFLAYIHTFYSFSPLPHSCSLNLMLSSLFVCVFFAPFFHFFFT